MKKFNKGISFSGMAKLVFLAGAIFCRSSFAVTPENGITAHRGDSANFPQNSMRAFSSASRIGADWIETDVHLTKDRRLVLIHDSSTGAYCSENKKVKDFTYAELASLDMAEKFRDKKKLTKEECPETTILLLDEALDFILKEKKARLSIQPKCDCVDEVMALVRKKGALKWVGFNDANKKYMKRVKELEPGVPVFWDRLKSADIDKDIPFAKANGFEYICPYYKVMTPEMVKKIKEAGFKVGVWTVNSPKEMKKLLEMGVDRLYTDHPEAALKIRKSVTAQKH